MLIHPHLDTLLAQVWRSKRAGRAAEAGEAAAMLVTRARLVSQDETHRLIMATRAAVAGNRPLSAKMHASSCVRRVRCIRALEVR